MKEILPGQQKLSLEQFDYTLNASSIASYPSEQRDGSKLLEYSSGTISHYQFAQLPTLIGPHCHLVFNDTKVIPARFFFKKPTGAIIEVFILNPISPSQEISQAMESRTSCSWLCMIGNLKKWREEDQLKAVLQIEDRHVELTASLLSKDQRQVQFQWNNSQVTFAEIVEAFGSTPLPPYIDRPSEQIDKERYQTVYSKIPGAVAAPTAGLHFNKSILTKLVEAGNSLDYLTLHVGAGTFQPIKADNPLEHQMHAEQVVISRENIDNLLKSKFTIAVGTTSMRSLESLYWFGVKLLGQKGASFHIDQMYPYQKSDSALPDRTEALEAVLSNMFDLNQKQITGSTSIYIVPGYQFKVCDGLITNFHQPKSTLLLLISAFIGNDWRQVYQEAIDHQYKFLSYGDSSLLIP